MTTRKLPMQVTVAGSSAKPGIPTVILHDMNDPPETNGETAVFHGRSFFEAQLVCSLLKAHGLDARVKGQELLDGFAAAHQFIGDADVVVPSSQARMARMHIAAARHEGGLTDDAGDIAGDMNDE